MPTRRLVLALAMLQAGACYAFTDRVAMRLQPLPDHPIYDLSDGGKPQFLGWKEIKIIPDEFRNLDPYVIGYVKLFSHISPQGAQLEQMEIYDLRFRQVGILFSNGDVWRYDTHPQTEEAQDQYLGRSVRDSGFRKIFPEIVDTDLIHLGIIQEDDFPESSS